MKKSKSILITSIILVFIIIAVTIVTVIYANRLKPYDYPAASYKNAATRYFENNGSLLQESTLLDNDLSKFTLHHNYFDVTMQIDHSTDVSLALNSFFNIQINVVDGKVKKDSYSTEVSNGFNLKVYLSSLDSYVHPNNFYKTTRQSIEAGNVYFEFKPEDKQNYEEIYNLRDLYVYDDSDLNYTDYFNDLRFVNDITTKNQRYILIENYGSQDKLFHKKGDYRLKINHRSRFISSGDKQQSEYFEEQIVFCSFKKIDNELENILIPENHTLNEFFYTLKFTDLIENNTFIVSDSINIPKISVSSKLIFESNCFITRTYEDQLYSIFLVDPKAVQFEMYFQEDYDHDIKTIYSITNFVNEDQILCLKDKNNNENYYQPKEESQDLTARVALTNKGIYCIKISYKVQSIICSNLKPMGEVIECEDIYYFQVV